MMRKPTEVISVSRRLLTAIMPVTPSFSQLLLLAAGLAALAVFFVHDFRPAAAQDGEPPTVGNLRCIAETHRVAFLWDTPNWHGGEVSSYDYDLTLPDGRREIVRIKGSTLVYRPGSYQPGRETSLGITVNYEVSGGGTVTSDEKVLVCSIGGEPPTPTATPTATPTPTPTATPTPTPSQDSGGDHATLIAQIYQWRNDPCCVSNKAHTDRWDRALLAFGETMADTTLTPMTAAEAQGYADRGWNRWVDVAEALQAIEAAAAGPQDMGQPPTQNSQPQQHDPPANSAPTVSNALSDITIVNQNGTHEVSLSGVFSDADKDALTVTATSSNESVATVSVSSDGSTLTVTATARGTTDIMVTADDGNGGTVSDTFTVTVKAAPVVSSALADVTGLAAGATREVSLSGVFSDADGDSLTVTATSSEEAVATVSVSSDGSSLTVSGVVEGTATVTVLARDADGNRVLDDFDVSVAAEASNDHAALIAQIYQWRNDPCCVSNKAHTDRWDRALLTFGETVADTTLTPMTAAEAQGYADRGWNRWVDVAEALREMETPSAAGESQQLQTQTPGPGDTVWSATLTVVNEGRFVGCDDAYGHGCELKLSENSFTYKGKTYVVTGLYLHRGRYGPYDRSITMKFWRTDISPPSYLYRDPNLHELALRIDDDALFSIVDGILYLEDFTVWKNPGISWTTGDEVSVSLEVLTPAPTSVTVTPGDEQLDVSWTAPTVPAGTTITGYELRYFDTRLRRWRRDPIATGSTSTKYTLTGLTNGWEYLGQVRATHSKGHGAWYSLPGESAFHGFRSTPVGPAYAPTDVKITHPSDRRLLVEWDMHPRRKGGSPITGYHVHYTASTTIAADAVASGMDPAAGWIDAGDSGTDTAHWISGLTNDTAYRIRVRAVNVHGNGDWSEAASGTPLYPAPLFDLQTADIRKDGKPGLKLTYRYDPEARPVEVVAHVIDPNRYGRTVWDERAPGGTEVVWPARGVNHILPAGASISCVNDTSSPGVGHCEVVGLPPLSGDGMYHTRIYARVGEDPSRSLFVPTWYQPYTPTFIPTPPGFGLMNQDND